MDNAYEVVVFALGLLCAILFLGCIFGAVGCNVNPTGQERVDRPQEVAYKADDDLWYPGKRLPPQQATWLHRVRGFVHVETGAASAGGARRTRWSAWRTSSVRPTSTPLPRYREPSRLEDGTAPSSATSCGCTRRCGPSSHRDNGAEHRARLRGAFVQRVPRQRLLRRLRHHLPQRLLDHVRLLLAVRIRRGDAAQKHPKVLSPALARRLFHKLSLQDGEFVLVSEANQMYAPRLQYNYASKVFLASPRARGV